MKIIDELLSKETKTVAITGHVRPDGDCIGSVLALWHYIRRIRSELQIDMYLETVPTRFEKLPGAEHICTSFEQEQVYDVMIALDSGDLDRIGLSVKYFATARETICIDHHISNLGYANKNFIQADAASTCEILFSMMEEKKFTKELAMCLYLGMAHDTGVFQYSNTTAKTMEMAAKLLDMGVEHTRLINETFYEKTYIQTQVLGRALMECILVCDGRCAVSVIKKKDMDFYGVSGSDMDGIVNQLQLIKGTEVAVFMYELEDRVFKVSLRSKDLVNVSTIATIFGGGGHVRAAGCTISGGYYDAINSLTRHIQEQLDHTNK